MHVLQRARRAVSPRRRAGYICEPKGGHGHGRAAVVGGTDGVTAGGDAGPANAAGVPLCHGHERGRHHTHHTGDSVAVGAAGAAHALAGAYHQWTAGGNGAGVSWVAAHHHRVSRTSSGRLLCWHGEYEYSSALI
jgi:hypothetical protein